MCTGNMANEMTFDLFNILNCSQELLESCATIIVF